MPIFEKFGIERQIKSSFGKTVSMQKGAYLVIEHTEALHVIDVNSGNRSSKLKTQEDTAMEVNLIASAEIARQLKLRDMGGIIVIDFIDLFINNQHWPAFNIADSCITIGVMFMAADMFSGKSSPVPPENPI